MGPLSWPQGRRTGVPETTTDEDGAYDINLAGQVVGRCRATQPGGDLGLFLFRELKGPVCGCG